MKNQSVSGFQFRDKLPETPSGKCEWFALCENEATKTRTHATLGEVPICEHCDKKLGEALS